MMTPLRRYRSPMQHPATLLRLLLIPLWLIIAPPALAQNELYIDINRAQIDPYPIAIPEFSAKTPQALSTGQKIAKVVADDLLSTELFQLINPKAYIQKLTDINASPRFADWRTINAKILLQTEIILNNGQIQLLARLWDVDRSQELFGQALTTDETQWRRLAHLLADLIYQRMTGEKGYFDTRIVYIAETGSKDNRTKRLAIMDQDGANHKYLTDGKRLVLTPRFSPGVQTIVYLSYPEDGKPQLFLYDLQSGKHESLGAFEGMQFAPRFSYDGKKLIMSLERNGNSDIYVTDINTRKIRRLTKNKAIDTSPSYAPDGRAIVFNSDRGGSAQLYIMDADGRNIRRLSYGRGIYSTPVWSPRGDTIAFTKYTQGQFFIGVMQPDGTGERTIAKGYLVEGPTWSPNGRVLMFARQGAADAKHYIYSIDLTGYNFRRIKTPGEATDPAWSPPNP